LVLSNTVLRGVGFSDARSSIGLRVVRFAFGRRLGGDAG
jgi:hypothetical protein